METPVKLTVDVSPIDFLHRQPHEIGNYKGTVSRDWFLTISSLVKWLRLHFETVAV